MRREVGLSTQVRMSLIVIAWEIVIVRFLVPRRGLRASFIGAVVATLCLGSGVARAGEVRHLSLAAGEEGGVYFGVSRAIAAQVNRGCKTCRLAVVRTDGSSQNLDLLESGKVDIALVQSDLAYLTYLESGNVVALAGLFEEPLHVVARSSLEISSLTRLGEARSGSRTLRVFLGAPRSGTRAHARLAMDALPVEARARLESAPEIDDLATAVDEMLGCRLDLLFLTSAVPAKPLEPLLAPRIGSEGHCGGDLIGLGAAPRSRLLQDHSFFTRIKISPEQYGRMGKAAGTVAVRTLLVARKDLPDWAAREILRGVYGAASAARGEVSVEGMDASLAAEAAPLQGLSIHTGLKNVALPLHRASLAWHEENLPDLPAAWRWMRARWLPLSILLLACLLLLAAWRGSILAVARPLFQVLGHGLQAVAVASTILLLPSAMAYGLVRLTELRSERVVMRLAAPFRGIGFYTRPSVAALVACILALTGVVLAVIWLRARFERLRERILHRGHWYYVVLGCGAVLLVALWIFCPRIAFLKDHTDEVRALLVGAGSMGLVSALLWGSMGARDVRLLSFLALAAGVELGLIVRGGPPEDRMVHEMFALSATLLGVGIATWSMSRDLRRLAYVVHQHLFWSLVAWLLATWLIGSSLMFLFEGPGNPNFSTLGQSMIAILYYLFSGLEAREPVTIPGQVASIGLLTFGVAIVGFFTAAVIERILAIGTLRHKPWWLPGLENHFVIVGWTDRTRRLLAELRKEDLEEDPLVAIATGVPGEVRADDARIFRKTWLVEGDICEEETLRRANVSKAKAALILREPKSASPDHRAIQCALAVKSVAAGSNMVRIVGEIQRQESLGGSESPEIDEAIITEELSRRLLVQCVLHPGISGLYEELFAFGVDSPEVYLRPLPQRLRNRSFDQLVSDFQFHDVTPIGYAGYLPGGNGGKSFCVAPTKFSQRMDDQTAGDFGTSTYDKIGALPGERLIFLADQPQELYRRFLPNYRKAKANLRKRVSRPGPWWRATGRPPSSTELGEAVNTWVERAVEPVAGQRPLRVVVCGEGDQPRKLMEELSLKVDELTAKKKGARPDLTLVFPEPPKEGEEAGAIDGGDSESNGYSVRVECRDLTQSREAESLLEELPVSDRIVILASEVDGAAEIDVEERTFAIARNLARLKARKLREMRRRIRELSESDPGSEELVEIKECAESWANLRIVVEVTNARNRQHFERIRGVEVVSISNLVEKLVAQAGMSPEVTRVFDQLLRNRRWEVRQEGERPPDLMIKRVDHHLVQLNEKSEVGAGATVTYDSVAQELHRSERDVVLIGYRCARLDPEGEPTGEVALVLNPPHRRRERDGVEYWRHRPLRDGDALVLLTHVQRSEQES